MQLRVRFDDGFVAYFNGREVARENVADPVRWDSLASTDRPDELALRYVDLTLPIEQFVAGKNLLAVQTFKSATSDLNLLFQPQLVLLGSYAELPVYLATPTPGQPNISDAFRVVESVSFSVEHGFYDQPFGLQLSTPTSGAEIRYTLDGSVPTAENSAVYQGPIEITSTQTVRAVAFKPGLEPSLVGTRTYIFLENVIDQSRSSALARGFPSGWGVLPADYAMDQRIVGQNGTDIFDGRYAATVRDDLKSLPTLSLVLDFDDLFGPSGIYSNPQGRGIEWERPVSVELIYPDGRDGFQSDAGIRIQGGISRFISSKLSLRLLFKDEYGPAQLEFPMFGPDAAAVFDSISLRSSSGEHLVGIHFVRDEFARRLQLRTGSVASHGNYMHLYINGLYWGMYNPVERIDGQFAANYYGGDKEDYDVLNGGDLGNEGVSAVTGSLNAWNQFVDLSRTVDQALTQDEKTAAYLRLQGLNPDGSRNPDWEVYLDPQNYIDYLITQVYLRNRDWPQRNYYMLRRLGPDSTGFKFYVWDAEFTLDQGDRTSLSSITREGPGIIYQLLDTSEAFRVDFSDRVQMHFAPGGAFYVNPENRAWDPEQPQDNVPAALYAEIANEIFAPLGPETARWGDELARNGRLFLRDTEWQATVQTNLTEFFPNRSRDFLADLRRDGFYRDAPSVSLPSGFVEPGVRLEIGASSGSIYYTLDGSDPRLPDGAVSAAALVYSEPIAIEGRTTLRTRSLDGNAWSAIEERRFVTDALPAGEASLRITELNYHPHAALTDFGEMDVDNDEFEFIELMNVTDRPLDLTGVQLVQVDGEGVQFTFGRQLLPAGERVVVGRNPVALNTRYGDQLPLAQATAENPTGGYEGRLGNGGETVTLRTATGQLIERLTYGDDAPWPERADGNGSSLELIDLAGARNDPANYRRSAEFGGSPGQPSGPATPTLRINEVLANPGPGEFDAIELVNVADVPVDASGWFLSDSNNDYFKFRIPSQTVLAAGDYGVWDARETGIGLSGSAGDEVYLIESDASGRPLRFVDEVRFDASDPGVTLGRWPDATGPLFPMIEASLGTANAGFRIGDVILTEVYYQPRDPDGAGSLRPEDVEFVELFNRSDREIDLGGWRLDGSVQFVFPSEYRLAAGETVLVTNFDRSANPLRANLFRLALNVDPQVALQGPWQGMLPDLAGEVRLLRPANPTLAEGVILVDEVTYSSAAPWPAGAKGTGASLQRRRDDAFAPFASSWAARPATPGAVRFEVGPPGDVTEDGRVDAADIDLVCQAIRELDSRAEFDLDLDGLVNRADYDYLIQAILQTRAGDADLNGVFDSGDLVAVFISAEYEDDSPENSTWAEGDWDCDGDFTSADLVAAFIQGQYARASGPAAPIRDAQDVSRSPNALPTRREFMADLDGAVARLNSTRPGPDTLASWTIDGPARRLIAWHSDSRRRQGDIARRQRDVQAATDSLFAVTGTRDPCLPRQLAGEEVERAFCADFTPVARHTSNERQHRSGTN